jgi:Tol biopolymer transport system component
MKRRLILLIIIAAVWLVVGCGDQPSLTPTTTATAIQPTETPEPTEVFPTPTPTEGRPAWLPIPPENPTILQITDNPGWKNENPIWSPDGSQILYRSNQECVKRYKENEWEMKVHCQKWDWYLIDVDGSNEIRLTDIQSYRWGFGVEGRWAPDGERIAILYSAYTDTYFQRVLTFSVDQAKKGPLGLEDMEVLIDKGEDYLVGSFEWSPDGEKYAYDYFKSREPPSDGYDIVVVDSEKGEEIFRKTTAGDTLCFFEAWSPNGEGILIMCEETLERGYRDDLYWIDVISGNETLLRRNASEPVWSPDGKWLLYRSGEGGKRELLHLESGEIIHLPYYEDVFDFWDWSPDGKWLAITQAPELPGVPYLIKIDISLLDISWLEMEWD